MSIEIGKTISHYKILRKLGHGGMGEVYEAHDEKLDRSIALKVLKAEYVGDDEYRRRFLREARSAAAVNHPYIASIYEAAETDGTFFIAMEYVEGQTLRSNLTNGPLAIEDAQRYAIEIAEGLAHAHQSNLVHRDLKPDNIMIASNGHVKILDFGLATVVEKRDESTTLSLASAEPRQTEGTIRGTPAYMSPEQARGKPLDSRSDIFSFGSTVYEMVTGKAAFRGPTHQDTFASILKENPAPANEINPKVPAELNRIISRCLNKKPEERYNDTRDLTVALTDLLRGAASQQTPARKGNHLRVATIRRHRPIVTASLIVALVAVMLLGQRLATKRASINSVAVLPFVNDSGDDALEYLADGIAEGVINRISGVRDVRVMARTTVFRFKGTPKDPQEIGTDLGVEAVVSGRLVRRGNGMAVQVDLTDVKDKTQIWGQRYDCSADAVVSVEYDIARDVASLLRPSEEVLLAKAATTTNRDAYRLNLQGLFYLNKRTATDLRTSIDLFKQAVATDPEYADAYAGLARAYELAAGYGVYRSVESMPLSETAAIKALVLAPGLGKAHVALAAIKAWRYDWNGAEQEYLKAIDRNPSDASAYYSYALNCLTPQKRYDEAISEYMRALAIEPFSPIINANFASTLLMAGRPEEAEKQLLKTLEAFPGFPVANRRLCEVYVNQERYEQAWNAWIEYAPEAKAYSPVRPGRVEFFSALLRYHTDGGGAAVINRWGIPFAYAGLGDVDKSLDWLGRLQEERDDLLPWRIRDPVYDTVRSSPRYTDLMRRINLEP